MVLHESKAGRGGQGREVGFLRVMPFLSWPRQCRFEDVLVADSWQPAVFAKLVVVDGINNQAAQPPRLR